MKKIIIIIVIFVFITACEGLYDKGKKGDFFTENVQSVGQMKIREHSKNNFSK